MNKLIPRRSVLNGVARVWVLNVVLTLGALALHLWVVRDLPGVEAPFHIPWPLLAAAFCAGELCVVHLHFRRDAHSFTLAELPLVLGLFFAAPGQLVVARLIGSIVTLGLVARQRPIKLVFNLALFWLEASLAVIIFGAVTDSANPFGPTGYLGALPALVLTSFLGVVMIFVAISLSEGGVQRENFGQTAALAMGVTAANASLSLVAAASLATSPEWAWLLVVPAAVLFFAYRGYSSTRRKHESLEFLFNATKLINDSRQIESALLGLLEHTRGTFRSEIAEITLFPGAAHDSDRALRTTLGPGDAVEIMNPVELDDASTTGAAAWSLRAAHEGRPTLVSRGDGPEGIKDALVAPLRGETRVIGTLMVANHLGDVSSYDGEDLKLFETLGSHISVALENGRLEQSLAQLTELKEEFEHLALHDALTGLPNRALFNDRVEHAAARAERRQIGMAVMFVDVDDFKVVNDSLGHAAGDELLQWIAERIGAALRPSDTAARLGGDEFAILLEDIAGPDDVTAVAERIISSLRSPFSVEAGPDKGTSHETFVSASIGIALALDGSEGAGGLLRQADVAMYRAKANGKGRYEIFQAAMHTDLVERLELVADLRRGVERGEFEVVYQPIVSLEGRTLIGAEALVRWRHPERGVLAPAEFIDVAEERGLVFPIGRSVLRRACADAGAWSGPGPAPKVSVNLSGRQIGDPGLAGDVGEILADTGLEPERLILEVTERGLMLDAEAAAKTLAGLKCLGVRIAVDDFGVGYSSLGYLRRFPIDILKIDRSFVDAIDGEPDARRDADLTAALVALGSALGLEVVAKGVESPEQLEWLRARGCELGQGYLFAAPVEAALVSSLAAGASLQALSRPAWVPTS